MEQQRDMRLAVVGANRHRAAHAEVIVDLEMTYAVPVSDNGDRRHHTVPMPDDPAAGRDLREAQRDRRQRQRDRRRCRQGPGDKGRSPQVGQQEEIQQGNQSKSVQGTDGRHDERTEQHRRERSPEGVDRERRTQIAVSISGALCQLREEHSHGNGRRQENGSGDTELGAKPPRHRRRRYFP